ncbi:MAG: hypothetical protein ACFE9R_01695, partial [Candidatus Hermodarchaeota archaeon]
MSDIRYNTDIMSPFISKLIDDINSNKQEAVLKFWRRIESIGTPHFEKIDGDINNNFITFIARADKDVKN